MKNGIDYTKYHDGYHGGFCAKNDQVLEVGKKKNCAFFGAASPLKHCLLYRGRAERARGKKSGLFQRPQIEFKQVVSQLGI